MNHFRAVVEVLKWADFTDVLRHTVTVSRVWEKASDCDELWDQVGETLSLQPREEGKSSKQWFCVSASSLSLQVLSKDSATVYSVPSLNPRHINFDKVTNIDQMTCFCFIRPLTLLCCGGNHEDKVYEVNINSGRVAEKPSMIMKRNWSGILKVEQWVYVLGGSVQANYHPSSEKYSIERGEWSLLRGKFKRARNGFVPVRVRSKVYCIGRWPSCELLDLNTEEFTLIELSFLSGDYWTLSLQHSDLLIVTQVDDIHVLDLELRLLTSEKTFVTRGPWSNSPPVVYQNCAYSVMNPNPPEGLLQVDFLSYVITKHPLA